MSKKHKKCVFLTFKKSQKTCDLDLKKTYLDDSKIIKKHTKKHKFNLNLCFFVCFLVIFEPSKQVLLPHFEDFSKNIVFATRAT